MRPTALVMLLAAGTAAQTPPAASTAPAAGAAAVSSSTSTAPTDEVAGRGFKVGGKAPQAKLIRPIHAVIQKDAADWDPVSLRAGGVPGSTENSVVLKILKVGGKLKGERTLAKSAARMHRGPKDSRWLVISLYPKSLEIRRAHIEIRFRLFEGYIEEVQVAAVAVTDRRRALSGRLLDSFDLRGEAVEYQEEQPGSGHLVVAELDPRPSARAVNSGRLENAEFAGEHLGFVSLSWAVKGLAPHGGAP